MGKNLYDCRPGNIITLIPSNDKKTPIVTAPYTPKITTVTHKYCVQGTDGFFTRLTNELGEDFFVCNRTKVVQE